MFTNMEMHHSDRVKLQFGMHKKSQVPRGALKNTTTVKSQTNKHIPIGKTTPK